MRLLPVIAVVAASFLLVACSAPTPPPGVTVVSPFNPQRYLGTWYEIARFDHHFESGLEKVTATYSLRDDGGLDVVNKGYNPDRGMWQKTDGVAYFTGASAENPARSEAADAGYRYPAGIRRQQTAVGQSAVLMRAHFQANDTNHNTRQAGNAHRAGGFA